MSPKHTSHNPPSFQWNKKVEALADRVAKHLEYAEKNFGVSER